MYNSKPERQVNPIVPLDEGLLLAPTAGALAPESGSLRVESPLAPTTNAVPASRQRNGGASFILNGDGPWSARRRVHEEGTHAGGGDEVSGGILKIEPLMVRPRPRGMTGMMSGAGPPPLVVDYAASVAARPRGASAVGGQRNANIAVGTVPWIPLASGGDNWGVAVVVTDALVVSDNNACAATCAFCKQLATDPARDPLFKPCPCDAVWHRSCFKKWRQGWINPKNYYACPMCMHNYTIEWIAPRHRKVPDEAMHRSVTLRIAKMWLGVFFAVALCTAMFAGLCYGADLENKNVPVIVKAMMTSVAAGFPNSNSTAEWRDEFRRPDVAVWQYYSLLGAVLTALVVLILAGCAVVRDEGIVSRTQGRTCCEQCHCDFWTAYYCTGCAAQCSAQCADNKCCWREDGHCTIGGQDCPLCSGGCKNRQCDPCKTLTCGECCRKDGMKMIVVCSVLFIGVVLVSAVFVLIIYGIKKAADIHEAMAAMFEQQAYELENQTVVLGMNETVRPLDAV